MIEIRDLCVRFGEKTVLAGFSAEIPLTGTTAVEGPSGSGKTTLLRTLAGLIAPQSGAIFGLSGLRAGFLFQEDRLLPWRTALENVCEVTDERTARALLDRLGLGGAADQRPQALSGGMRRRTAIARLLAFGGDILLLEEPFTGLDEAVKRVCADAILSQNVHIVVVTHDPEEAEMLRSIHTVRVEKVPGKVSV